MEKEELLERVREENKAGDERQSLLEEHSCAIAFIVMILFGMLYYLWWLISGNENDVTHLYVNGVVFLGMLIYNCAQFYSFRKKSSIFWIVIFGFNTIAFFYYMLSGGQFISSLWS